MTRPMDRTSRQSEWKSVFVSTAALGNSAESGRARQDWISDVVPHLAGRAVTAAVLHRLVA